jgi:hypothetical protein
MITSYQRKAKLSGSEIGRMMSDETWLTAKEALDKGFVTHIGKAVQMAASIKLDPSHYKNIPKEFLPGKPGDGPEANKKLFEGFDVLKKRVEEGVFKTAH